MARKNCKNFDGPELTTHHIKDLLPTVMQSIGGRFKERPDLILAAWPEVIGPQFAPMTTPVSFEEGVLVVKVKNSTLYALLNHYEKFRILESLRQKFPSTPFHNIQFRMGG